MDPNIQVGAILKQINGNNRVGNSDYFILEACEYVESFLKFSPKSSIVLNIDNDHLDYFKNMDNPQVETNMTNMINRNIKKIDNIIEFIKKFDKVFDQLQNEENIKQKNFVFAVITI